RPDKERSDRSATHRGGTGLAEFVNPYAFAPFADPPERKAPTGHAALDNYSGVLTVTLRARTPLLLGGFGPDGSQVPRRADGRLMIPGSGLLGAVRSVHEAMVGGWLLVTDTQARNANRPMYFAAGRPGDGVAVVTEPAWVSYLRRVEGTRDMQRLGQARRDTDGRRGVRHRPGGEPVAEQFVDVTWPPPGEAATAGSAV